MIYIHINLSLYLASLSFIFVIKGGKYNISKFWIWEFCDIVWNQNTWQWLPGSKSMRIFLSIVPHERQLVTHVGTVSIKDREKRICLCSVGRESQESFRVYVDKFTTLSILTIADWQTRKRYQNKDSGYKIFKPNYA